MIRIYLNGTAPWFHVWYIIISWTTSPGPASSRKLSGKRKNIKRMISKKLQLPSYIHLLIRSCNYLGKFILIFSPLNVWSTQILALSAGQIRKKLINRQISIYYNSACLASLRGHKQRKWINMNNNGLFPPIPALLCHIRLCSCLWPARPFCSWWQIKVSV